MEKKLGQKLQDTNTENPENVEQIKSEATMEIKKFKAAFEYNLEKNQLSNFDIAFLKVENNKENKIYSPLSIKYTLK